MSPQGRSFPWELCFVVSRDVRKDTLTSRGGLGWFSVGLGFLVAGGSWVSSHDYDGKVKYLRIFLRVL